jgi:single-strand DNA-binding protein
LGADPQVKYTPQGKAVANFSLATNTVWKDAEGNKKEKTNWHHVVVWEKLADFAGKYLKKGNSVYIEGSIETRSYEDAGGVKKYITEIRATDIEMLGKRGEASEPAPAQEDLPF